MTQFALANFLSFSLHNIHTLTHLHLPPVYSASFNIFRKYLPFSLSYIVATPLPPPPPPTPTLHQVLHQLQLLQSKFHNSAINGVHHCVHRTAFSHHPLSSSVSFSLWFECFSHESPIPQRSTLLCLKFRTSNTHFHHNQLTPNNNTYYRNT